MKLDSSTQAVCNAPSAAFQKGERQSPTDLGLCSTWQYLWSLLPERLSIIQATSVTYLANPPKVSKLRARPLTPERSNVPKVGLKPTTPQYDAGLIIEPAVCVPIAKGTMPAATAAADPLDEPPGVLPNNLDFECSMPEK